jgi:hypothetical protein
MSTCIRIKTFKVIGLSSGMIMYVEALCRRLGCCIHNHTVSLVGCGPIESLVLDEKWYFVHMILSLRYDILSLRYEILQYRSGTVALIPTPETDTYVYAYVYYASTCVLLETLCYFPCWLNLCTLLLLCNVVSPGYM